MALQPRWRTVQLSLRLAQSLVAAFAELMPAGVFRGGCPDRSGRFLCAQRRQTHQSTINHRRHRCTEVHTPPDRPLTLRVHRLRAGIGLLPLVCGVRFGGGDGRKCCSRDGWVHEEAIAAACTPRGCAPDLWRSNRTTDGRNLATPANPTCARRPESVILSFSKASSTIEKLVEAVRRADLV